MPLTTIRSQLCCFWIYLQHSILLNRLENCVRVTGKALRWFKSYLLGQSQSVVIDDATSESLGTKIGVPQGAVLGPLLFLIYTLPLADLVKKTWIIVPFLCG